jgi:aspartate aminotransferase
MTTSISNIFGINKVSQALDDPHYGLRAAYRGDSFERKLDLVIGIYRDDEARPWVLPTVRKVCAI